MIIAEDHLDNDLILEHAESTEEDEQRDFRLHTRNRRTEIHDLLILRVILDADGVGLGDLLVHGADGFDLNDLPLFCGVAIVAEDDGAVL